MRQDILAVLHGRVPGRIPWTIHHELLPRGSLERELRSRGLAVVEKGVRPYQEGRHRVWVEERWGWDGGVRRLHRRWHTPLGELRGRQRVGPDGSLWTEEYPLKSAADFRLLEYISEDTEYRENRDAVASAQRALGEDGLVLCRLMRSPLQRLLVEWLGAEGVSYALADAPRELDRLISRLAAKDEEALALAAASPAEAVWSAENVTAELTGPELFGRYHRPYYDRAASILRAGGKLYGVHLDGRLRPLKEAIGQSGLDFVEGFNPPPLGDVQPEEARAAWPGKAIWLNIPANLFLGEEDRVVRDLKELAGRCVEAGGFLLTLTEEFPDPERSLRLVGRAMAPGGKKT